jgi:DNA-binding CsgD family transcriptional regulator
LSEIDLDTLYKIARGMSYKQIAVQEGLTEGTIKARMLAVRQVFGATSMPNLMCILIASDVLRLQDLYQAVDIHVREYRRTKGRNAATYRLCAVRI